ncbi:MAG: hypothetical protein CMH70_05650 [Nitrosomonadaceae bacterium]|nr:hypothetical protein [Nitrosomonadaceae bacterium]|tara:strand:+ start:4113 stop:4907 length:795 start_codon:yes stop_codon:yes gene_type:complete
MPHISVVTSVYNGENYLKECVDSILNQTFQDFEYIILNNGSTDGTGDILAQYKDPRLRIFNQENLGIVNSLNKGTSLCRSELIAHLDADDFVYPSWLEKQFNYMIKNQEVVVSGSRFQELFKGQFYPQSFPFLENDFEIRKNLCLFNPIPHSFTVIRKSILQKVGGYDPNLVIVHDYDLWVRLLEEGKGHNLNEVLGVYRVHQDSFALKKEQTMIKESFKIQWKAYRKLGGNFGKMFSSIFRKGIIWFLPAAVRSNLRAVRKRR